MGGAADITTHAPRGTQGHAVVMSLRGSAMGMWEG